MDGHTQVGRIALRSEGEWWNAYYALNETMEGAILLGTVRLSAVTSNPTAKQQFITCMRTIVADVIQEKTGVRPVWNAPVPAPESERSGRA